MKIEEAMATKHIIEEAIAKMLNGFVRDTGMRIERIEIKDDRPRVHGVEEKIRISLDVRL